MKFTRDANMGSHFEQVCGSSPGEELVGDEFDYVFVFVAAVTVWCIQHVANAMKEALAVGEDCDVFCAGRGLEGMKYACSLCAEDCVENGVVSLEGDVGFLVGRRHVGASGDGGSAFATVRVHQMGVFEPANFLGGELCNKCEYGWCGVAVWGCVRVFARFLESFGDRAECRVREHIRDAQHIEVRWVGWRGGVAGRKDCDACFPVSKSGGQGGLKFGNGVVGEWEVVVECVEVCGVEELGTRGVCDEEAEGLVCWVGYGDMLVRAPVIFWEEDRGVDRAYLEDIWVSEESLGTVCEWRGLTDDGIQSGCIFH